MHASPTRSPTLNGAAPLAAADARTAAQIRVLYAGNAEFARMQFASEAPQLHLVIAGKDVGKESNGQPANVDVALVDSGAPGVNAAALVEEFRGAHPDVPIVLAVDPAIEDAARLALQLQVDDYTVKSPGWVARLPVRLSVTLARGRRSRELAATQKSAERLRSIVEAA